MTGLSIFLKLSLTLQVKFICHIGGEAVGTADIMYRHKHNNSNWIIDMIFDVIGVIVEEVFFGD